MNLRRWPALLWRNRPWFLGAGALLLTGVSFLASDNLLVRGTDLLVAGWWLALVLVLPIRLAVAVLCSSAALTILLDYISRTKAELTHLPLMAFDLRIVAEYPDAFVEAMELTGTQRVGLVAGVAIAILALLAVVIWEARRLRQRHAREPRATARAFMMAAAAIALIAAQLVLYVRRLPDIVDDSRYVFNIWEPTVMLEVERRLGTVPFLYYSHVLEGRAAGNLVLAPGAQVPEPARIESAARRMLRFRRVPRDSLPNIVLVKVESTFDLNEAFRLATPVTSLLYDRADALAYGMLRVNAVGGGSWISEYEAVTGVDSRLFGFSGLYTHAALAPLMRGSLATWLHQRGYRTATYYPVEGTFHNARRAFPRYGFDRFFESEDFGFEAWDAPDSAIARAYLQHMPGDDAPFFAFFVFNENHGPHRCRHFDDPADLQFRFAGNAPFEVDCGLNEFVRGLRSSEYGVRAIIDKLRTIEERTGRPWLLVTFGDHQPHSFTGSGGYADDYAPFRRSGDLHNTMYRFAGTAPDRFVREPGRIPVTLIPTLISAFVAADPADLYLGANLLLFDSCGPDAVGGTFSYTTAGTLPTTGSSEASSACASTLAQTLASYRHAGILLFEGKPPA